MNRAVLMSALLLSAASGGCTHAPSIYRPRYAAEHELTLSYDQGYILSAGGRAVARGYSYEGLSDFVGCVPAAGAHARAAEGWGSSAVPLQVAGSVLAVGGIGGLAGIGYIGHDKDMARGLLLGGLGVQVLGLILVGIGAQAKVSADGHAVDAMNEYNDAAGSRGRRCPPRPGRDPRFFP